MVVLARRLGAVRSSARARNLLLAEEPLGSFVEVFHDVPLIAESDVGKRILSTLSVPRIVPLADCTRSRARAHGVTAAIHSSEDYAMTQRWASAFADAGFGGIRYLVSHDPAQRLVGIGLFGPAGSAKWPAGDPAQLGADLLTTARHRFGMLVLPAP